MKKPEENKKRYWLKEGDNPYKEVTKEEWVSAERNAGCHQTNGDNENDPSTRSFRSSNGAWNKESIEGEVTDDDQSTIKISHVIRPEYTVFTNLSSVV